MRLWAGTSGYSYEEWRGGFYPDDAKPADMLGLYARKLPCVEVNNTFYRMPKTSVVRAWADSVPDGFRFVIKASRRITHRSRLKNADDAVRYLFGALEPLGDKLGAILFQLPPTFRKDIERLERFLSDLPECRAAFEFRHDSWHCEEVYRLLGEHGAALVGGDDDEVEASLTSTAAWGYARLRRSDYDDAALDDWAHRLKAQPWTDAFVFFKHESLGPQLAGDLIERVARIGAPLAKAPAAPLAGADGLASSRAARAVGDDG